MNGRDITQITNGYNACEIERCPFPTGILKVNLNRLESNILSLNRFANEQTGRNIKFLFPIKTNAYGSGMIPVAKFVELKKLCTYFGVACIQEAMDLRKNGIVTPILIMSQSFCELTHLEYIVRNDIEQAISDKPLLHGLNAAAKKLSKIAKIHLDIDTGMGRCGALCEDVPTLLEKIGECKNIRLVGVMTHFSVADVDEPDAVKYTKKQIKLFNEIKNHVLEKFPHENIIFHTSNSGGVINHAPSIFDMIRPGIATYGYPEQDNGLSLQPIMEVTTKISLIKTFLKKHSIGYGCTYKTRSDNERIAIIPVGYGDGLSRSLSNKLTPIVNGKKAKSVGRISMDQLAIGVDKNTNVGDEVIIIGERDGISNTAYDLAAQSNTITYEVLCNLGNATRMRHEYAVL